MCIKVLLVDDHQMMRDGLRSVLEKQAQVRVVGEAGNGREALELFRTLRPDVIVMDIGMPQLNGIEATRRIMTENPRAKVIALSTHADKRYVLEMLEAGARGYVLKEAASSELLRALNAVTHNKNFLSPEITGVVMDGCMGRGDGRNTRTAYSTLTTREREVLQLLAEGKTSTGIAAALHISSQTVETHRRNLMRKLDLHNVAELTKYAIKEGITGLED